MLHGALARLTLIGVLATGLTAGSLAFPIPSVRAAPTGADTATAPADAARLSAALLTGDDLPPGWRVVDAGGPIPSSYAWCPAGAPLPVAPLAQVARSFEAGALGPILYQSVLQFRSGEATQALAALRATASACTWDESEGDVEPMQFELSAATELDPGDEALHRRLTARWGELVAYADVVVVRQGAFLAILTHLAVGDGHTRLDARLTDWASGRVAAKLAGLAGDVD
jgi:hypothetical protein